MLSVVQAALETDLRSGGQSEGEIGNASRVSSLHVLGDSAYSVCANVCHSWLWWSTIGTERSPFLCGTALRVFYLSSDLAGVEPTFKIGSRVHGLNRIQLSNDKADKQCHVIYKALQAGRLKGGVLATKRGQPVESLLIVGYEEFVKVNGSALSQLIAPQSDGDLTDLEDDERPFDLDEDEFFGSPGIETFSDNIDALLSTS